MAERRVVFWAMCGPEPDNPAEQEIELDPLHDDEKRAFAAPQFS